MEDIAVSLFSTLSILALFAALLFVVLIWFSQKNEEKSKKLFSYYLLNISFVIFFFLIYDIGFKGIAFVLIPFLTLSVLLIPPMMWVYIQNTLEQEVNIKKHIFLPLGVFLLSITLMVLAKLTSNPYSSYFKEILTYLISGALTIGFLAQNIIYIYKSIVLYKKHTKKLKKTPANVTLKWLKGLIYGYLIFIVGIIIANVFHDLWSDIFYTLTMLFYIVFVGYYGTKQEAFVNSGSKREKLNVESTDFFKELKSELIQQIENEKIYLNQSLTIQALAKQLSTNSKYLSQLINVEFGKSFIVFVNEYRIKEAKKQLLNPDNKELTIEAIGNLSGFKSKSSFNIAFKKETGQTPSMFIKKQQEEKVTFL